ncbi:aminoglycoside phosphotransferase [Algoriphagus kandeliae]|uniref:Aminoglycoside phosphotransferase n=1 Tax=Algoriphagus kandeliae TaxID=2562278 RepID=A0A4Y9R0U0_9BACT|nr:phosphotransferase [Algoriphagus kandeliae]TFV97462.1 aminoglycoside phosphotransferase [Algoriphagus kandeliae]
MKFTLENDSSIEQLQALDCWNEGEKITNLSDVNDSNMNKVLRIHTDQRSVIAKQSRPYVRKFPQIPAPIERIQTEKRFYEEIQMNSELLKFSPRILAWYPESYLLITEDLGQLGDFSGIYSSEKKLEPKQIQELITYLNQLHQIQPEDFPDNLAMRELNHEHIFNFPFNEHNGFDLNTIQEGLQELSLPHKSDKELKNQISELGKRYLKKGNVLIHGDYYPGSWMDAGDSIKIIDPEFSFMGDAEFDLGVFLAHADFGDQGDEVELQLKSNYNNPIDWNLVQAYRGVEIMRRLIGIAQLPLELNLVQKEALLNQAKSYLL